MSEIFKIAASIATPWNLAAFAIAAILYLASRKRAKISPLVWVSIVLLVTVPTGAALYQTLVGEDKQALYRVRVTVTSPQGIPVEDAKVWSSVGGEAKKVSGGWEFEIPSAVKPASGELIVYASRPGEFQSGRTILRLESDHHPAAVVALQADAPAWVRGIVLDSSGQALSGARVGVVGYESESVITKAGGSFSLPAHKAQDQQVLLHAEKPGYEATSQWHPAGDAPATIVLSRH